MASRFLQIFWGLLLAITDITINGIDILPDFIGYILVGLGCAGLGNVSRRFGVASTCSIFLTLIALAEYFIRGEFAVAVSYVRLVLDCVMMWTLLGGVMDFANSRERFDLARTASNRRALYVGFIAFVYLVAWLGRSSRDLALPVWFLCLGLMIFVVCLILGVILRAKRELA